MFSTLHWYIFFPPGSSGPRKTVAEKIQASVSSSSSSESASNGTNGGGANSSGGSQKGKVETFSVDDDDEEEASKAAEGKKDELNGNNSNAGEEGAPQPKADKKRPVIDHFMLATCQDEKSYSSFLFVHDC